MFRYLLDKWFLTCVGLYALNRWAIKPALPTGELFFRGYFNDLLVIPCALPPLLFLHRKLRLRHSDAPPRAGEILLHLVIWSLFFEAFAPLLVRSTRADALDVVAYCAGGLVSWLIWNWDAVSARVNAPRNLIEKQPQNLRRCFYPDEKKTESFNLRCPYPPLQRRRRHRAEEILPGPAPFTL